MSEQNYRIQDEALIRDDIAAYLKKHEEKDLLRLLTCGSVDDDRLPLEEGEQPLTKKVRFRTLGCYPLTGAVESEAETIEEIVQEMLLTTTSERQGRVIDFDGAASMEEKKKDGYF